MKGLLLARGGSSMIVAIFAVAVLIFAAMLIDMLSSTVGSSSPSPRERDRSCRTCRIVPNTSSLTTGSGAVVTGINGVLDLTVVRRLAGVLTFFTAAASTGWLAAVVESKPCTEPVTGVDCCCL